LPYIFPLGKHEKMLFTFKVVFVEPVYGVKQMYVNTKVHYDISDFLFFTFPPRLGYIWHIRDSVVHSIFFQKLLYARLCIRSTFLNWLFAYGIWLGTLSVETSEDCHCGLQETNRQISVLVSTKENVPR
jgi:hypothetical protein